MGGGDCPFAFIQKGWKGSRHLEDYKPRMRLLPREISFDQFLQADVSGGWREAEERGTESRGEKSGEDEAWV